MNIKNNFVKVTAVAALTLTGVAAVSAVKPDSINAAVQAATTRVKINYVPGYGVNIWTNYNHGHFTGQRAQHGTTWNVRDRKTDKKGYIWYKIGTHKWIKANYTVSIDKNIPMQTKITKKKKTLIALSTTAKKRRAKAKKSKVTKIRKAKQIVNATHKQTITTPKKLTSTQASSKAAAVVALAKQMVGKGYVWGATGPDTFDCSGLVQYVYQHAAGTNLPRTTYDQVKVGQEVPMDQLQAGDLLFWGSATTPYYVGIYVGNNQYVNAATPEQGTIIQTMTSYYYPTIAKRIL